ncbi:MAG: bestrophin family protein [Chitinophagaceae bacterium]|jgi:putative membrane protein
MIHYNPKDWFTFIFRIHKGDTVRKLFPLMIGIGLYSALIVVIEKEYFKLPDSSYIRNIPTLHTVLGAIISLLLVFRTNSAYDRWWEGRKQWGELTNNSRNLAIKLHAILGQNHPEIRDFFKRVIPAYAFALRNHLLSTKPDREMFEDELQEQFDLKIDDRIHIPNQIADMMMRKITHLNQEGIISDAQLIILNEELRAFSNICGACERIKNTPIPFSYSVFIKKFIFGYVMTLPFGYMFTLGYLSIPIIVFIFYVLASLELIAEEIEDPFGGDANDLPTDTMSRNIHNNVEEILQG